MKSSHHLATLTLLLAFAQHALCIDHEKFSFFYQADSAQSSAHTELKLVIAIFAGILSLLSTVLLSIACVVACEMPTPTCLCYRTYWSDTSTCCGHNFQVLGVRQLNCHLAIIWILLSFIFKIVKQGGQIHWIAFIFLACHAGIILIIHLQVRVIRRPRDEETPVGEVRSPPNIPFTETNLILVINPGCPDEQSLHGGRAYLCAIPEHLLVNKNVCTPQVDFLKEYDRSQRDGQLYNHHQAGAQAQAVAVSNNSTPSHVTIDMDDPQLTQPEAPQNPTTQQPAPQEVQLTPLQLSSGIKPPAHAYVSQEQGSPEHSRRSTPRSPGHSLNESCNEQLDHQCQSHSQCRDVCGSQASSAEQLNMLEHNASRGNSSTDQTDTLAQKEGMEVLEQLSQGAVGGQLVQPEGVACGCYGTQHAQLKDVQGQSDV